MTPRKPHFPRPPFDQHHADAIEVDVLLQDPTISRLDRNEGRSWVQEFDAKYRAKATASMSAPVPAPRAEDPASYMTRPSRRGSLTVVLVVGPLVLLLLAAWMVIGWVAGL